MTDSRDINKMVDAPLTFAEVRITPGCHELEVIDLDSGMMMLNVTKVDCSAGIAWVMNQGFRRSHPIEGRFKLVCLPEALERYKEEWKSCV